MKLDQIVVHEEACLERTVTCPDVKCNEEVQLRKFNEDASSERCTMLPASMFGFGVAFNIVFKYCGNEFNQNENHSY